MKIPKSKNQLLKVYWHDHALDNQWRSIKEIETEAQKNYDELCETVGYLIVNKPKYIVLSNSFTGGDEYGGNAYIIKKDIEKIERL
jgi:hypothetical protein